MTTDDRRIVGAWTTTRLAPPPCNVRMRCPECFGEEIVDAYDGPATHTPCKVFMIPVSVVRVIPPPERFPKSEFAYPHN